MANIPDIPVSSIPQAVLSSRVIRENIASSQLANRGQRAQLEAMQMYGGGDLAKGYFNIMEQKREQEQLQQAGQLMDKIPNLLKITRDPERKKQLINTFIGSAELMGRNIFGNPEFSINRIEDASSLPPDSGKVLSDLIRASEDPNISREDLFLTIKDNMDSLSREERKEAMGVLKTVEERERRKTGIESILSGEEDKSKMKGIESLSYKGVQDIVKQGQKPLSTSQMQANIVQEMIDSGAIKKEDALRYLSKKGITFQSDSEGNITVEVGGSGEGIFKTKRVQGELEKKTLESTTSLADLMDLTDYAESIAPEVFQYLGKGEAFLTEQANKLGLGGMASAESQLLLAQLKDFESRAGQSFTLWRKWATGVQAGQKELDILLGYYPNPKDSRESFIAKAKGRIEIQTKSLARLIKLGLLDNVQYRKDGSTFLNPADKKKLDNMPLSSFSLKDAQDIIATSPINKVFGFPEPQPQETTSIFDEFLTNTGE